MIVRRSAQVDLLRIFEDLAPRLSSEYLTAESYQGDAHATFEDAFRKAKNGFRKAIRENRADTLLMDGVPLAIVRTLVASNWSAREDVQRWFEILGYEFACN
ncbi:hypothetical protein NP945_10715 [Mesorhizobium sp. LMG17149]|uniref:hypothetical protein n=1 Tax=Mesorhizobium sp. LMG17149 TaxID=2968497 RepID=UPI0021197C6A|nr:hypothetical protein [Mesorhizobium sp. LMG17149]MCQ8872291.1 hypothetical protein [Mesorhizobium sp. LMG17149]